MASWYTAGNLAQHPGWINGGTPEGQPYETSDSVLARMPQLLADHPSDVVVILVGAFDMADPSWEPPCGWTCDNMKAMINMAQKAGSKVILCTSPNIEAGSAGTPLLNANPNIDSNEEYTYHQIALGTRDGCVIGWCFDGFYDVALAVEEAETLENLNWSDDGVTFNTEGAQLATDGIDPVIQSLRVGGTKGQTDLIRREQ